MPAWVCPLPAHVPAAQVFQTQRPPTPWGLRSWKVRKKNKDAATHFTVRTRPWRTTTPEDLWGGGQAGRRGEREQPGSGQVGGEKGGGPSPRHVLLARFQTCRLAQLRPPPSSALSRQWPPPRPHRLLSPPPTTSSVPLPQPLAPSFIHPFTKFVQSARPP